MPTARRRRDVVSRGTLLLFIINIIIIIIVFQKSKATIKERVGFDPKATGCDVTSSLLVLVHRDGWVEVPQAPEGGENLVPAGCWWRSVVGAGGVFSVCVFTCPIGRVS